MPTPRTARRRASRKRQRPDEDAAVASPEPPAHPLPPLIVGGVAAVVLGVPLGVLGRAAGPYDDPKAWALPILVGLIAVAWIVRARHDGAPIPSAPDGRARMLRWIVLAYLAWTVVTTVTSVAPPQSVLGTFGRGTGLLAVGSAALLFFLVRSEVRTARGVRSLVDLALLGSVPVCVVALGQAAGWNPLPKPWDPAIAPMTVRSTLGSHIFLGSYLVMLMPLAAARLEWACRDRVEAGGWSSPTSGQWVRTLVAAAWVAGAVALIGLTSSWPALFWALIPWGIVGATAWTLRGDRGETTRDSVLTAVLMAGLLVVQVVVVVLSRGRGAFIGMVVGVSVTVLAFLIRRRAWKTLTAATLGLLALIVFLVLLNVPNSPLGRVGKWPLLRRLSEITNVQRGSPGWVRLQVWRGIADGWSRQIRGEEMIPGVSPRVRSLIGYGPETQLIVLEPLTSPFLGILPARGEGWQALYVFDRSHNVLLDHLVTEGLVGAALWILLIGGLVVVGVARIRTSIAAGETTMRLGALGAVLGHVAEGQVGIATPMVLALFWLTAALLTAGRWDGPPAESPEVRHAWMRATPVWATALVGAIALTALVGWVGTRWLLASVAYADGTRDGIAGRLTDAHEEFKRSLELTPWLALPAEASAYTVLRLAGPEADLSRRLALLQEGQATLAQARRYAMGGADSWALTAQLAFSEARTRGQTRFPITHDAFAVALRLRPGDSRLLAQMAWVSLESGDTVRGYQTAKQAVARDRREWFAWAVLARAATAVGTPAEAQQAAARARAVAPPEAHRLLHGLLPP
jgi:hypothetical protein